MDRSELEKRLLECTATMAERALLSLVEAAERVLSGDRNGSARRAEEAARRQKLQSAADASARRVKEAERETQARLERKRQAAEGAKPKDQKKSQPKEPPKPDEKKPDAKNPA